MISVLSLPYESKPMTPLLAFDSRLFHTSENAVLLPGPVAKHPANPLFSEEAYADPPRPWEARVDNVYPCVIYDDGSFKCFYKCFIIDPDSDSTLPEERPGTAYHGRDREEGLLYAESSDGIQWMKPSLGIINFGGSRDNNIVMRRTTHGLHAGGVLHDPRDPDPARRYKFLHRNAEARRMASCFSADGLRWSQPVLWREHDAVGDTHNNAIWSAFHGKYIGITRGWSDGIRTVLRSESGDFVNWTQPQEIMRGADEHDQIYSMPIIEYAGLFIGLPATFHKGDAAADDWDTVDTELAWSADSHSWQRIAPGTPLIPRGQGSYPNGAYDCGCVYAAAPIFRDDKILIYYGGSNGLHNNWRESSLNLATLPRDRFAGFGPLDNAKQTRLTTAPLRISTERLTVNAEIETGGSIRACLLDAAGSPLPGYDFDDCVPLHEGGLDCELRFADGSLDDLPGRTVRIAFALDDARLYALTGAELLSQT